MQSLPQVARIQREENREAMSVQEVEEWIKQMTSSSRRHSGRIRATWRREGSEMHKAQWDAFLAGKGQLVTWVADLRTVKDVGRVFRRLGVRLCIPGAGRRRFLQKQAGCVRLWSCHRGGGVRSPAMFPGRFAESGFLMRSCLLCIRSEWCPVPTQALSSEICGTRSSWGSL